MKVRYRAVGTGCGHRRRLERQANYHGKQTTPIVRWLFRRIVGLPLPSTAIKDKTGCSFKVLIKSLQKPVLAWQIPHFATIPCGTTELACLVCHGHVATAVRSPSYEDWQMSQRFAVSQFLIENSIGENEGPWKQHDAVALATMIQPMPAACTGIGGHCHLRRRGPEQSYPWNLSRGINFAGCK